MARAQRKISDEEAVLDEVRVYQHWPHRPGWICDADAADWPCEALRGHLLVSTSAVEISMAMASHYIAAVRELDLPPAEVHRRLFGWINGPTPPEPAPGWHPPGGSI